MKTLFSFTSLLPTHGVVSNPLLGLRTRYTLARFFTFLRAFQVFSVENKARLLRASRVIRPENGVAHNLLGTSTTLLALLIALPTFAQQSTKKEEKTITISGDAQVFTIDKDGSKIVSSSSNGTSYSYGTGYSYSIGSSSYGGRDSYGGQNYSLSINCEAEGTPIEKQKKLNFNYTVNATDRLQINNQFGDVKVELWDKKEIKIEVTIIGRGSSEKKAQDLVDGVEVIERKEAGKISLKTEVDYMDNWWGFRWGKKNEGDETEEKRSMEINYAVFMPKGNPLTISDKYGKIIVPEFAAALKITSNYGSFSAEKLVGAEKDIFVQYGSAKIKQMDEGDLKIYYSKLSLEKADKVRLQNNYGSLNIDEVNDIDAQIQYSSGKVGKLKETGRFSISYSGDFVLPMLSKTLKSLEVKSNYTPVRLPVTDENNFDFQVDVSYANFRYPSTKTTFTENPDENEDDDRKPYHFVSTKSYKGKFGKAASSARVVIKANYAPVKFVEKQ